MQKSGSTKYLQLPSDSTDIGKPSPLALLAATCQRIGAPSPARPARRRTPSPIVGTTAEPTPAITSIPVVRTPSPVHQTLPKIKLEKDAMITKLPQSTLKVKVPSPDYRLPLTPPITPTSGLSEASSPVPPRVPSIPTAAPVSSPPAHTHELPVEYPYHMTAAVHPHHQQVLHAPALRYSPYAVIVPGRHHVHDAAQAPVVCAGMCCATGAPVACPSMTVPTMYYPSPYMVPVSHVPASTAPMVASQIPFGTYLHHDLPASHLDTVGKIRARPYLAKSSSTRHSTPYDITRLLKKSELERADEVVDVVSV